MKSKGHGSGSVFAMWIIDKLKEPVLEPDRFCLSSPFHVVTSDRAVYRYRLIPWNCSDGGFPKSAVGMDHVEIIHQIVNRPVTWDAVGSAQIADVIPKSHSSSVFECPI